MVAGVVVYYSLQTSMELEQERFYLSIIVF